MNDLDKRFGYLIEVAYGDYDDFNHVPIFICETEAEAQLICEAIDNLNEVYIAKIRESFEYVANALERGEAGAQYTKLSMEGI